MKIRVTKDINEIQKFYSIVCNELHERYGITYDHNQLVENYKKNQNAYAIYIVDNSEVIGGFELHDKSVKTIPCEDFYKNLSCLAGDICMQSKYDSLVIFPPKEHTILYRRSFKKNKHNIRLNMHTPNTKFKINQFHKDFYLTSIYRTS